MIPNFINNVRTAFENGVNEARNTNSNTSWSPNWRFPDVGIPFGMSTEQQQHQAPHPQTRKAPPASIRAIRQLPTIRVAPADLVDPNNRECCICLENNNLDDIVTRLPCAHIFHTTCILDWLRNHSCTCPVCRYELATDDPEYESGRLERMKTRRPRYAMHELSRMTVHDLLALSRRPNVTSINYGGMEKAELIQMLIDQGRIDVVPTPEPVEYKLETLKRMRIGELKRTMNDNGVYFRPEDVVEKSDMLVLFQNSGRLVLTMEPVSSSEPFAESTFDVPSSDKSSSSSTTTPTMGAFSSVSSSNHNDNGYAGPVHAVETVTEESDDEAEKESVDERSKHRSRNVSSSEVLFAQQDGDFATTVNETPERVQTRCDHDAIHAHDIPPEENTSTTSSTSNRQSTIRNPSASSFHEEMDTTFTTTESQDNFMADTQDYNLLSSDPMEIDDDVPSHFLNNNAADQTEDLGATFKNYSISQLQALAQDTNIDLSSCFERRDMVTLFVNAGIRGIDDPTALSPHMFSTWSVSQLRAVASQANIDLSRCADRDEMVDKIIGESSSDRQQLRVYLRTLSPLTRSSLSELRAIAREMRVDISDCLEKDEIIQRMISRGPR